MYLRWDLDLYESERVGMADTKENGAKGLDA